MIKQILPGKNKDKGRPGLTHWQILVLGIVRNARYCDYDQLEDLAAHHTLVRQFLYLPAIAGEDLTNTPDLTHKTISNNVCHITEEILQEINKIVAQYGHNLLSKKRDIPDKIIAKCDTYVCETNVHYPTDINLLWDAARKTTQLADQ
jgi:transposase, IS5 family